MTANTTCDNFESTRIFGDTCKHCGQSRVMHGGNINMNSRATAPLPASEGGEDFKLTAYRHPDGGLNGRPYVTANGGGYVCEGYRSEYSVKQLEKMVTAVNSFEMMREAVRNALEKVLNDGKQPEGWVQIQTSAIDELRAALTLAGKGGGR